MAQKDTDARWTLKFAKGRPLPGGKPGTDIAIPSFGYKSSIAICRRYGFITFFETHSAWRAPTWMARPRGPDVSPELRWYPLVTFLQLGLDMMIATTTPMGRGHVYAPEHYVDAWTEVTRPLGWTAASLDRLKRHLAERLSADENGQGDRSVARDRSPEG